MTSSGPVLLVADRKQNMFDVPGFLACGQAGDQVSVLSPKDLVLLPPGSNLYFLPDRSPLGFNVQTKDFEPLGDVSAVAAFVPPGYTHLFSAAYVENKGAKILPLFAYTPVAFWKGALYVPAVRVDRRPNHDIHDLDRQMLQRKMRPFRSTDNRLIRHLALCACQNSCPNAINFFLGRYECPLPVSPACNASCLGCISFQPKGSCPATQARLKFSPTAQEIAEVALSHIKTAAEPVVSFGQGCEGEPLLAAKVMAQAIGIIRGQTARGTIHMNTNASLTADIDKLCRAGLDSLRVSLNSARKEIYERYYSPRDYGFEDVVSSISAAKRQRKFVSLNYLVMPGLTDRPEEFEALVRLIRHSQVDMIQWRNLNYDPQLYFQRLSLGPGGELLGIRNVIRRIKGLFPKLRHGYFNLSKEKF